MSHLKHHGRHHKHHTGGKHIATLGGVPKTHTGTHQAGKKLHTLLLRKGHTK